MLPRIVLATLVATIAPGAAEPRTLEEVAEIPDIVQTDPALGLETIGRSFCGPAAVANALAWLHARHRPAHPVPDHGDLVRRLASQDYMRTDPESGTGASGMVRGIHRALADLGIRDATLTYHGWRAHPQSTHTGDEVASLDDIAVAGHAAKLAWINVGWYRHDPPAPDADADADADSYTRIGGHWVSVVTSGLDADGKPSPHTVAIHDPAPRTGLEPLTQFVTLETLAAGTLEGTDRRLPRPAVGHLRLADGMIVKKTADLALVDGLLVLHLAD